MKHINVLFFMLGVSITGLFGCILMLITESRIISKPKTEATSKTESSVCIIQADCKSGNTAVQLVKARDYQLDVTNDSILIFDGPRHVKTIFFENHEQLGAAIEEDNH